MTTAHDYSKNLLSLPYWSKTQKFQEFEENDKTLIIKSMESIKRKKIAVLQINQILKSRLYKHFLAHTTKYYLILLINLSR